MDKRVLNPAIAALVFASMGTMLLLVLAIFERAAFPILFDISAGEDAHVRSVFRTLKTVVDVLPYTLGPFILGSLIFGLIHNIRSRWRLIPLIGFIIFLICIIYNITLADTALVVETLKNTSESEAIDRIRYATQAVMRQHHIGCLGFASFLICELVFIFQTINKS